MADEAPNSSEIADDFISAEALEYLAHNGDLCLYNGRHYERTERCVVERLVDAFIGRVYGLSVATAAMTRSVVDVLLIRGAVPTDKPTPCFLDGNGPRDCLAVRNGILSFDALHDGGEPELLPHSANFLSFGCADYDYDPAAECPEYERFQEFVTCGDAELAMLMDEVGGYALLLSLQHQAAFFAVGQGKNGKSVWLLVIEQVLGATNCSHVPLEAYGSEFRGVQMLGKHANLVADANYLGAIGEAAFREVVAGDVLQFNVKFKTPINSAVQARTIVSANAMPRFFTDATWRRVIILPFDARVERARQIHSYEKRLECEAAGILNKWIVAAKRLIANKRFTIPERSQEALDQIKLEAAPVKQFLTECLAAAPEGAVTTDDIWERWQDWLQDNHPKAGSVARNLLCKEVRAVYPNVVSQRVAKKGSGQRLRGYKGIRFLKPEELRPDEIDDSNRQEIVEVKTEVKAQEAPQTIDDMMAKAKKAKEGWGFGAPATSSLPDDADIGQIVEHLTALELSRQKAREAHKAKAKRQTGTTVGVGDEIIDRLFEVRGSSPPSAAAPLADDSAGATTATEDRT